MTPDDKRRLAEIRYANESAPTGPPGHGEIVLLLRLLDEATAERDAAMAALREMHEALDQRRSSAVDRSAPQPYQGISRNSR